MICWNKPTTTHRHICIYAYNLHITCIHFVSIENIAHFTGPYLNWERVIVLVYSWIWAHTMEFFFVCVCRCHFCFILAIITCTEKNKKTLTDNHTFSNQLNVTGGCMRQNRDKPCIAKQQQWRQQHHQEKKLTNISAFL